MRRVLPPLLAVAAALPAAAQASGPRNLAMGGAGVAAADPWSAPFANPALVRQRDEETGVTVLLPFVTATARDDDELLDAVDAFQDTLDELRARLDAMDPLALGLRGVALDQLRRLDGRALDGEAEIGAALLAPMEDYSASLWMRVRADGRALPFVAASDIAKLEDPNGSAADLDDLDSEAVVVAAQRTEVGATVALEGALVLGGRARRVSLGVSPKIQWIETHNYARDVDDFDGADALDEFRSAPFTRSSSAFNLDLGLAAELDEGAVLGLALRDLVREDHPTVTTGGRSFSYRVQPRATLGAAVRRAGLTFTADLDLNPTRRFKEVPDSQFFRMGFEADLFRQVQLRAGFAHDIEGAQADLVSVGLGLSPLETLRLDLVGQFGEHALGAGLQLSLNL